MKEANDLGVVILGAGSSSRLGQPKQLLKFQKKTFLQNIIDTITPLDFASKVVVLGANADQILQSIDAEDFKIKINSEWQEGIASSIRTGVRQSLNDNPSLEHILFLLTDQPFVSDQLLNELLKIHLEGNKLITGSKYNNIVGVPAIFARPVFPQLMELSGDLGARYIINQYPDDMAAVDFDMGYFDIDTKEDYRKLLRHR